MTRASQPPEAPSDLELFDAARVLLVGTRLPLGRVARLLGFADEAAFDAWFVATAGLMPWELRSPGSASTALAEARSEPGTPQVERIDPVVVRRVLVRGSGAGREEVDLLSRLEGYAGEHRPPSVARAVRPQHRSPPAPQGMRGRSDAWVGYGAELPWELNGRRERRLDEALRTVAAMLARLARERLAERPASWAAVLEQIARTFYRPQSSVQAILQRLVISRGTLRRLGAELGITAGALIRECRMLAAVALLRHPDFALEEVALWIGFDDRRGFERVCERWCGLSPARLRAGLRLVAPELERHGVADEVFGWYFWERYHRRELAAGSLDALRGYLRTFCVASLGEGAFLSHLRSK